MSFPGGASAKNPPANAGDIRDTGLIPGSGRSPKGGYGEAPEGDGHSLLYAERAGLRDRLYGRNPCRGCLCTFSA